nr:MAG TPA: hypothetical protein [Microviridae sp.]
MREYYIIRYFDDKDVMRTIHQDFKCLLDEEVQVIFDEYKKKYYGVAIYKRFLPA